MKSTFLHSNFSVFDLEKSLAFYSRVLGLTGKCRRTVADGSLIPVYLTDSSIDPEPRLTWMRDRKKLYNLGDGEIHLAVHMPDKQEAYELYKNMGYICHENHEMDLYSINDPDGY